jgi:hypothetical protein
MSVGRKSLKYAAVAAVLSIVIIAASFLYMGIQLPFQSTTSTQRAQSVLAIRLTDPPQVPKLTSSLNLTYSSLDILVGEPTGIPGQLTTKTVTLTPSGGSATLDLLKLQNVSQTIASATLPDDSVIYSVTFTVSSMSIDVNGTVSSVSLASGGNSFSVTIAEPPALRGVYVALLQLNPTVVDTPTGYQLIPSAVGVIHLANGQGMDEVGSQHQLTSEDEQDLESAHGSASASLVALSVSGDETTVTVRVNNTGSVPVVLNAIGLHGNFTVVGCAGQTTETTTETHATETQTTETQATENQTATTTATTTSTGSGSEQCELLEHADQVVFVPVATGSSTASTATSTSTSTSCSAGQMSLVNGEAGGDHAGLQLSPGQCVELTFTGKLSFGESQFALVPSTLAGQTYIVHIIASNGAEERLSCVLPLGGASCTVVQPQSESD